MRLFGKTLSEYVAFEKPILAFVLGVGLIRLGLSLAGVPNQTTRWISLTVAMLIGVLYYGVVVHTSGFGSYKQLLGSVWLQSVVAQLVPIMAIVLAIVTGHDNVYTAPEFSPEADGKTWFHVMGHTAAGLIFLPLFSWVIGSIVMFVAKRVSPRSARG